MAIVLNTEAPDTSSVNNEMLFVAYEATKANDPSTYPDYAYICDVYVDSEYRGRIISRPHPVTKRGIFDVSKILQSSADYGLKITTSQTEDYDIRIPYQLKFGEQYGGVIYTNVLVDSTNRYCFETYKKRPFTSTDVLSNGLASNMPAKVKYHSSQAYHLIPYFSNVSGITDIVVTYYDSSGNSISSDTIDNSGYTANTIRQANILYSGVPSNAAYALLTGAGVSVRVDYLCDGKYTPFTLAWLNPYGAFDSQSFGMVSKKSIELDKKTFAQTNYVVDSSGLVSYKEGKVYYGSKRGFHSNVLTRLKLTSHILNDNEYSWLSELFASPLVYLYLPDEDLFIPVTIGQNNYDFNTYLNNKLSPLQFDVEFTDKYNAQNL